MAFCTTRLRFPVFEQNPSCLDLATRGLVLENGSAALAGDQATLKASAFVRRAYLGA
jgi:ABC-type branched-subunit amino acid transport system ATPase component